MEIFSKIIIFIIFFLIFYLINLFLFKKEYFCYGNDFCNGNKDAALCINQTCRKCGLQPSCDNDKDCMPNNCINGCCDQK